jgi:hypothetical protein
MKSRTLISFAVAAVLAAAAFLGAHLWKHYSAPLHDGSIVAKPTTPLTPLAIKQSAGPLRDGPRVAFAAKPLPLSARQQFLEGNFKIITRVGNLPQPVLQVFTEEGGSRFVIADPGKEFLATDVFYDDSLPQKRLIFAGVLDDKCFVYYEQGGWGFSTILAFFKLTSKESMEPLWRGYSWPPAADIEELRSQVLNRQIQFRSQWM